MLLIAAMVLMVALSWVYLFWGAGTGMSWSAMTVADFLPHRLLAEGDTGPLLLWTPFYSFLMIAMWFVMMVAMMVPSAGSVVLLYDRILSGSKESHKAAPWAFLSGYLLVWFLFSVLAALAQWGLEQVSLLHTMKMWMSEGLLVGFTLIGAGLYQLTPYKDACLAHCQNPAQFFTQHMRYGTIGGLRMGIIHGAYCLGCCWAVMLLLFVGGIMNLLWVAAIALYVLLEKVALLGVWLPRFMGFVAIIWGMVALSY